MAGLKINDSEPRVAERYARITVHPKRLHRLVLGGGA